MSYLEHKRLKALRRKEQEALEARQFQQWDEIQTGVTKAARAPPVVTPAELFFMGNDDIFLVRARYFFSATPPCHRSLGRWVGARASSKGVTEVRVAGGWHSSRASTRRS
jgi:hypothetical protein